MASAIGLLILAPVMACVALAVKLDDGGPIFFRHSRTGRRNSEFRMWKFRTMSVGAEKNGPNVTVAGDPRVTRMGYFLRRYRIDELPQLLNVLTGEMALVGPRPESPKNATLYPVSLKMILELTPGITDPGTLAFLFRETELISSHPNAEAAYLKLVVPARVPLSLKYAERATVLSDINVILATIVGLLVPQAAWRLGLKLAGPMESNTLNTIETDCQYTSSSENGCDKRSV